MNGKISLGRFIAAKRKNMKLTQEELADKLGVSKSAIAKWETDGGIPDRDNLLRLSLVIGVSVDELHRIIRKDGHSQSDFDINITPDIISILEQYGYKVTRPENKDK